MSIPRILQLSSSLKEAASIAGFLLASISTPVSGIQFQDVTGVAGINYKGPSFGASWGDIFALTGTPKTTAADWVRKYS